MNKHLNLTYISFPSDVSLHQLFRREVERNPHHVALVFQRPNHVLSRIGQPLRPISGFSTASTWRPARRFCCSLFGAFLEIIIGIFGILKAGAAYVPIDVDYPKDRMAFHGRRCPSQSHPHPKHFKENLPKTPMQKLSA
ncbi:MAG: hypothetical protein R2788_18850 [Saprospiraceae bacterium]